MNILVSQNKSWNKSWTGLQTSHKNNIFQVSLSVRFFKPLCKKYQQTVAGSNLEPNFYIFFEQEVVKDYGYRVTIEPDDDISLIYNPGKHKQSSEEPQILFEVSQILYQILWPSPNQIYQSSMKEHNIKANLINSRDISDWNNVELVLIDDKNADFVFPSFDNIRNQLSHICFISDSQLLLYGKNGALVKFIVYCDEKTRFGKIGTRTVISCFSDHKQYIESKKYDKNNPKDPSNMDTFDNQEKNAFAHDQIENMRFLLNQSKIGHLRFSTKSILIHGAPGTGKTHMVKYLSHEMGFELVNVTLKMIFDSNVLNPLNHLLSSFSKDDPSTNKDIIFFFDDIDILLSNDEVSGLESQKMLKIQFSQLLQEINSSEITKNIIIIACTSHIDAMDSTTRKLFEREILIEKPTQQQRKSIFRHIAKRELKGELNVELKNMHFTPSFFEMLDEIADSCHGYSISDLEILFRNAISNSIMRNLKLKNNTNGNEHRNPHLIESSHDQYESSSDDETVEIEADVITAQENNDYSENIDLIKEDFEIAKSQRAPESLVSQFSQGSLKVAFSSIGGLEYQSEQLIHSTVWLYKYIDTLERLGIESPRGVLLYGPPGTGKTLLAKAVASESNANFISISISDLIKGEIGASEQAISSLFKTARQTSPCIIFLDEIQAMFGSRDSSGSHGRNMISQLLLEMDGISLAKGVVVIAATNRPDWIDASLLRPGRFERCLYIPPPSENARKQILKIRISKLKVDSEVLDDDFISELARRTNMFTGADLTNLCMKAAWNALKESLSDKSSKNLKQNNAEKVSTNDSKVDQHTSGSHECIKKEHFLRVLKEFSPTVTMSMLSLYEKFERKYGKKKDFATKSEQLSPFKLDPNRQVMSRMDQFQKQRELARKQIEMSIKKF